jgi:pyrimidine operon attenuation protein/uracil phosphoribosyltransferase
MNNEKSLILNSKQVAQKLMRIAHEIHENLYKEKEIVMIGIVGKGSEVAERLAGYLKEVSDVPVVIEHLRLNKEKPLSVLPHFSGDIKSLRNKSIIVVDDVLNSGRTLIYASRFLLDAEPKALHIATLVDRFHRKFPIRADFVGLTLSTNLKEHVTVEMNEGQEAVYLE